MTRAAIRVVLEAELARADRALETAYWTFTRCRKGRPPAVTVPWAYDVKRDVTRKLRLLEEGSTR